MRILILFILSISNLLTCSLGDSVTQSLGDSEHQFHLSQVSIADSLYKSYLPQHNFEEVKAAVDFFELEVDETDDILLIYNCARAHYYHAVGLTERDDIIGVCEHYLRALELMETNFKKEDLDYEMLKFNTLTCNRLGRLFSKLNNIKLSTRKYEKALRYTEKINDTLLKAILYKEMGDAYMMSDSLDSALYYYEKSLNETSHPINTLDVQKSVARILYKKGDKKNAYKLLKNNLDKLDNYSAKYSYYTVLGDMYYRDKEYDSAICFYQQAMESSDKQTLMASIVTLNSIYDSINDYEKKAYYDSIFWKLYSDDIVRNYDMSKLYNVYNEYIERVRKLDEDKGSEYITKIAVSVSLSALIIVIFLICRNVRHNNKLHNQINDRDNTIKEIKKQIAVGKKSKKTSVFEIYHKTSIGDKIINMKHPNIEELTDDELALLLETANLSLNNIINILHETYPKLNKFDLYYICLTLLNVDNSKMIYLLGRNRKTIWERKNRIKNIMGLKKNDDIFMFLLSKYLK